VISDDCGSLRRFRDWGIAIDAIRSVLQPFEGAECRRGVKSVAHTIVISRLSWGAKMDFGISAWTPRTMSTTWVTRKLTATLHSA